MAAPLPKSQIYMFLLTMVLLVAAAFYWFNIRDTADKAMQRLAAQNIEINEANFFTEITAGHTQNIHDFLMAGGGPDTVGTDGKGLSAIMIAVQTGNKDIVAQVLAALPADPQAAAATVNLQELTGGESALMMAVEKDNPDIVKMLLARGADTAATNKASKTPLIIAVQNKLPDMLTPLINADIREHQGITINTSDSRGETPLTYAIREHDKDIVQALIAAKADAISADPGGTTPLMVAAEVGDEASAALLIAAGAKMDIVDRVGNSPISIAIRKGHPSFVEFLVGKGANPDYHTTGPLPLEMAVSAEPFDPQLFTFLLKHSKQTMNLDASMLFDAIDHKNEPLATALIEHGINAKSIDSSGQTLLYHAIENGLQDAAVALIDKGADIYQTGVTGITPLERAVKRNESKVVVKLLSLGISPDQKTSEGYTYAEMAVYSGYPEILDALLAKGAKLQKDFGVLWAIRDGGGRSVPVLLKYGAKPTVMSNSGDPALWLAASAGEVEAVSALIQYHAALDYPNASQAMTPLVIASHGGQLAVVKLLVEAGAKLEVPDAFGMTALAHAAYMSKPEVVAYLISKGANMHAADKQGRSIADLAALGQASVERDKVLELLQQKK